jgi:hypothetical protein
VRRLWRWLRLWFIDHEFTYYVNHHQGGQLMAYCTSAAHTRCRGVRWIVGNDRDPWAMHRESRR